MGRIVVYTALGIVFIIMGAVNCTGNISSIHWYNRRNVAEADVKKYGRLMGTGNIIIGAALLLTVVMDLLIESSAVQWIVVAGCVIGIVFMLYAQFKYNKGIV